MAYIQQISYKILVDWRLSFTTLVVPIMLLIIYLYTGSPMTPQIALGQAEETFGMNATFLDEVNKSRRQTEMTDQNQTTGSKEREVGQQKFHSPNDVSQPKVPIVTADENVYIVWWTNESGNWEVMFKASTDNGETFGNTINLSNTSGANSTDAEIAASGSRVFVSWRESKLADGSFDPVLRISNNSGFTFGPTMQLTENGTGESQVLSNISTFVNITYGVQLQYPSEWQTKESQRAEDDNIIDLARFISPSQYRLDKYRENLWVSIENLRAKNITLEEYSRDLIGFKNETTQDFNLLGYNTDSNILAGYPAYRLIYTRSLDNGLMLKEMEIGTKVDDKVYFLVYSAQEDKYADFLPIIYRMINSLSIDRK